MCVCVCFWVIWVQWPCENTQRFMDCVSPTTECLLITPVGRVPGIKALLSTGVAEALLVAAGLAGVGARALRFLLDGDWRAVKCHRYKRR